jgi:DNA-binding NtrC family response regulator
MLEILAHKGIHANLANDEKTAVDFLDKSHHDLVFTSTWTSLQSGRSQNSFELLKKIRTNSPELPVIMIAKNQPRVSSRELIDTVVRAIQAGCCDFLTKPLDREKIENILDTFLPNHKISTIISADDPRRPGQWLYQIVGKSAKLTQTVNLAKRIAPTSVPVLISGESGTGKELFSYLVHHKSKRAQGPYIRVNCAALNDSLLESELFGHEKGAFTGAYIQRKGRFEMAHGGTLLLDEITETPPKFQAKLLRVIEQQDFERVGGEKKVRVDVRIISTTNKDLLNEVAQGRFRLDLYYRLSGVRLIISPLRQRIDDLPEFVWHFVNLYARQSQRRITKLDQTMLDIFAKYHWPGNIRQLRNVVLTSLILGVGSTLSLADVSWLFDGVPQTSQITAGDCNKTQPFQEIINSSSMEHPAKEILHTERGCLNPDSGLGGVPLVQIERQAILDTLNQTAGNQTKAAKVLGISDRTLRGKLRRYRQQDSLQLTG